jgi:hypothetical protein
MASFAKLNSENIVEQVLSVHNNELLDNGVESETKGITFLKNLYGEDTNWRQTSYNTNAGVHSLGGIPFRKNHAGIGYQYDPQRDAFIPIKPYNSWVLNEETCNWEAPIAYPNDGQRYTWNEETQSWTLQTI